MEGRSHDPGEGRGPARSVLLDQPFALYAERNDGPHGLHTLEPKSIDVFIADPPYEAEAHTKGRRIARSDHARTRAPVAAPLPFAALTDQERLWAACEMGRLAKRWVLVFCQAEAAHKWRTALETGGLQFVRQGVWIKPDAQPQLTGDRPGMGYETIVIAHPRGRKRWNGGGRSAVWTYSRATYQSGIIGQNKPPHPTTKPLPLLRELVELFSEPGELVCDPYAGSGTTGVACRMLGRCFLGWEQDAHMAEIARRRIAGDRAVPVDGQMEMF